MGKKAKKGKDSLAQEDDDELAEDDGKKKKKKKAKKGKDSLVAIDDDDTLAESDDGKKKKKKKANFISSTSITPKCFIKVTGLPIKRADLMIMIAPLQKVTTGRVHNNAQNHGNAEVPECAKEADGVPALTDVKDLHFQPKLQDSQTHTQSAPRDA